MNLSFLDPYQEGHSVIHCWDARVKLVSALAFIVAINLTPVRAWPAFVVYLLVICLTIWLAHVSVVNVLRRAMLALPFILIAAVGLPFVREGTPLLQAPVLGWRLVITDVGVGRFANVIVKSWLSVLVAVTLILTTHMVDLTKAMQSLGIPVVLTSVIMLMYRYLYVLVDEALRMIRARDARTASGSGQGGGSLAWRLKVTGSMIGTLFLRTYERSERIYSAMLARGFTGQIRTMRDADPPRAQLAFGGMSIAALLLVAVLSSLYW